MFDCEDFNTSYRKGYPNINVSPIVEHDSAHNSYSDTGITTVHIPSLNYPRHFTYSSNAVNGYYTISGSNPYRQPCQSWIVDVYADKLVLNGFESNVCHDRIYGDILDKYIYTIDLTTKEQNNG